MTLILAFGVAFQLPVILTLLGRVGIITSRAAQGEAALFHRRRLRHRRGADAARRDQPALARAPAAAALRGLDLVGAHGREARPRERPRRRRPAATAGQVRRSERSLSASRTQAELVRRASPTARRALDAVSHSAASKRASPRRDIPGLIRRTPAMHDIKWIRENPEAFDRGLTRRGLAGAVASG